MSKKILSEIRVEYKKQRNLSEASLMALIDRYNDKSLTESVDRGRLKRSIVVESIKVEKLALMEAASQLSEDELRNQYFGMVKTLMNLSNNLSCEPLREKINDMQARADDTLMLGAADKKSMKLFMKMMADMSVITKGMLQLGTKITDEGNDPVGDKIATIKSMSGNESSPIAIVLNSLGTKRVKKGFFGGQKDEHQVALFVDSVKKTVASASPSFLKTIGERVFDDICQCIISLNVAKLQMAFNAYVTATMDVVDDKFLTSMIKPGVWGTLKGLGDLFSGGGAAPRI